MDIMLDSRQQQQTSRPPLLVGERAVWLGSGSGLPQGGVVRWMGKLQGMGPGWTVGLELDRALPYGGIDGSWCGRQLFQCRTKHGLLVPANVVVKEDALLRTFGISPVILNKPPLQQPPSELSSQQSETKSPQKLVTKPKRTKQSGDSRSSSQQSRRKPSPQPPQSAPLTPKLAHQAKPAPEYLKSSPQVSKPNQIPPYSPALPSTPFFLQATPPATPEPKPRKTASLKLTKSEPQTQVPDSKSETKSSIEQTENFPLSNVNVQPVPTETTLVQAQQPEQPKPKLEKLVQPTLLDEIKHSVQPEPSQVKVKQPVEPELTSTQVKPSAKLTDEVQQPVKPELDLDKVKQTVQLETTQIHVEKVVQPVETSLQTDKLLQSALLPQVKQAVQLTLELVQPVPIQQKQSEPPVVKSPQSEPSVVQSAPTEPSVVQPEPTKPPVVQPEPTEPSVAQSEPPAPPPTQPVVPPDEPSEAAKPKAQRRHKAPLPPPKSGYFHTAPARPNRHLRGPKPPAPQPPVASEPEKPAKPSSLPLHGTKENQEHAWSPLVADGTPPRVPLRRHNSLNGPRCTDSVISEEPPSPDELIYQWFDASQDPPTAPPRHTRAKPPMNNNNKSPSLSPSSSSSSFEDAIAAADAIYSERYKKHFSAVDSASSISSTSSSNRKSGGGFLSFIRWLRKGGSDSSEEKVNELSHAGSTNSIGTVVSAASSFAYVCPTAYHVPENRASLHYAPSSTESETYKHRLKQRDHARHLDKNLTLKRKYKLKQFACSRETVFTETLKPTPKPSTGSGGRGRKRPAPPIPTQKSEHYTDCSLPASLEQRARRMDMEDMDKPGAVKLHRRTASESAKDKRAGAYCHVRGKRRAPQPPANNRPNSVLSTRFKNPFPSFGRKKRQAPPPPNDLSDETATKLSNAEKQRLISNLNKLKLHAGKNDKQAVNSDRILQGPALITAPPIVLSCTTNAVLLQAGDFPQDKPESVVNKATLSPKPWYKRNSTKAGKVEKRAKKDEEEMPEVNYARVLPGADDGKRKSTMLASISELDREAAEIVQNHRKRAEELIAARNNSFYLPPPPPQTPPPVQDTPPVVTTPETPSPPPTPESPTPKAHTKGLISMFNAITNVSKVTVNTSTAAIAGFFSGETRRNRISQSFTVVEEQDEEESSTTVDVKVTQVQSSTSQTTNIAAAAVDVIKEDIKPSVSKVVKQKDTASDNKPSSQNESSKDTPNKVNSSQTDNVVARNKNKGSLYPRLSTIEPVKEPMKEPPPLPLSIAGIPDSVSPTRQRRIVWSCPRCTLENPRWRLTCDVCDMWRPSSIHEETVLPLMTNLHAEPDKVEAKDDTDDELKPPEPIGAIDWESELKRYFGPNDKKDEKKIEPPAKVVLSTKVEEAIKILEGKTQVVETPKPGPSKLKLDIPKAMVNGNKEPEYAAVALNKKTNFIAAAKSPEPKNVVTKVTKPVEKPVEKKSAVIVKTPELSAKLKPEEKVEKKAGGKNVVQKTPVKVAEAVKAPENFIGGRTKADEQKVVKGTDTKPETKPEESKSAEVITPQLLTKEDVDEVRKARLAFFNKPQDSVESVTDALPPASPRLPRAKQSVGVPDVPSSPRLVRARTAETSTDTQELLQKLTMTAIATPAITAADREERMKLREKLKEMKNSLPKHAKEGEEAPKQVKLETEVKKEVTKTTEKEIAQGAIKKATRATNVADVKVNKPETSYENVRVKKVLNRAVKVSTSVQTSGAIVARKPKVEEPATGNIKGGKLYTSLSKSPSFRGTGTFQLMGAKDFATIEATKSTEKATAPAPLQHVYANVPSPGLVQDGQAKNEPAPAATAVVAPPAPPAKLAEVSPPITAVAPPNQVVVKVETNAQIEGDDDDYDDELMRDDLSSSGAADSAISASGSLGDSDVEKLAGLLTRPKGLAEFKADLAASPPQQQSNTLAVNRLLRRLEAAIASGQHRIAAGLARDLARLKVSCSVIRQRRSALEPELFTVDMYVEDKVSHQGPIPLSVCAAMTVGELKVKVQQEFEIPANVQRWILGKQLASDDSKTLQQHSVAAAGCTVFLYLVAPPDRAESSSPATEPSAPAPTPPPVEETRMVPTREPPRGPGWYYNFEEDRYSYCESSDEDEEPSEPEEEPQKPAVVLPPAPLPPAPTAPAPVIQLAEPEQSESSSEEEEEEVPGGVAAGGLFPSAPPATLTPEKKTGTLMLGWRCPVCTLINSPTRPGCAACTTERPTEYHVPLHYQASDEEAQRLRREQEQEQAAEDAGVEAAVEGADNYQALLALDNTDLVANVEVFECTVCLAACAPGDGAVLRECLHAFCRPCLAHTAQFSEEVEVRCPFRNQQYACDATLQEREVRALVPPEIYERMQAKSVAQAENKIQNAFHCKTPDCRGWCIFEDNVNDFGCPVCGHHNCLTCQAIHDGLNCRQYQERVTQASETDAEARRTKEMLEEMVERGEALCCPTCQVVLMKKWGCDWLRCSMCKTEICWVTRGHRWGPGGKGDTTGGCKCGINGIKCHPKCNYCH